MKAFHRTYSESISCTSRSYRDRESSNNNSPKEQCKCLKSCFRSEFSPLLLRRFHAIQQAKSILLEEETDQLLKQQQQQQQQQYHLSNSSNNNSNNNNNNPSMNSNRRKSKRWMTIISSVKTGRYYNDMMVVSFFLVWLLWLIWIIPTTNTNNNNNNNYNNNIPQLRKIQHPHTITHPPLQYPPSSDDRQHSSSLPTVANDECTYSNTTSTYYHYHNYKYNYC